jgi:phosphatidate cytidylyltransferase
LISKGVKGDGEELKVTRQFKQRILMSSLGILGLVISIYYSYTSFFKPIFVLLNGAIISFALLEYYRLAEGKNFQPLIKLGIGSTMAYTIALAFSLHYSHLEGLPMLILLGALLLFFLMFFKQQASSIGNLAVTVFGIVYLTLTLSCVLPINYWEDGRLWLAYVLMISKMTDIGAYFSGKIFGKTKLAPDISPKKTVEGALGGTLTALITSLLFSFFFPATQIATSFKLTWGQSIWIGLIISILAQLGDLAESLLKRDAGVKDSSHLPGLGGVLDVVDSLVFTLPFMYLLLQMRLVG